MNYWFFSFLLLLSIVGLYALFRLYIQRAERQRRVLEKRVAKRTAEISSQKEELQKQSEALQKAYEEIKTKNTAIEEAFEHLTNSFARLSDVNREKDGIISIVAHDLRTPLNNIEGLIQLVSMDGNLNNDQQDYISKIRTVVRHGNEMIRDLLEINKAKNQKPELTFSKLQMSEFVEDWKAGFEEALSEKKQKLTVIEGFKPIVINTDSGLLSRIMDNLMSNAIKFSEMEKTIRIELNPVNDELKISISDEGPGISEEDQLKMFKPFTRLSAKPTHGEPSNGLGLSIVKSLSQQLGGTIEVKSKLGQGTSFVVSIPIDAEKPMARSEDKKTAKMAPSPKAE